jgi:hypothetical protein
MPFKQCLAYSYTEKTIEALLICNDTEPIKISFELAELYSNGYGYQWKSLPQRDIAQIRFSSNYKEG